MRMKLTAAKRLVVAADFKPDLSMPIHARRAEVRDKVLRLAEALADLGVTMKVNSILRAWGYGLIDDLAMHRVDVFGDLKLTDISETLSMDGALLSGTDLRFVTAMCGSGKKGLKALAEHIFRFGAFSDTKVIGVTALTSLDGEDVWAIHNRTIDGAVQNLAGLAKSAGLDGIVASPAEATMLREKVLGDDLLIVTPAVRPISLMVTGDDQNLERVMTPSKAIQAGADVLVIGRPITQAENPRDATLRVIDEIASVT